VTAFVSGRFGSAAASLVTALVLGVSPIARRGVLGIIAIGGVFDGTGLFLPLRHHTGLLSVTALLTSFYRRSPCSALASHARAHDAASGLGAGLAVVAIA